MGFLSEIKKLLFAQQSVAKSGAEKATEYVREKSADFSEAAKEKADNLMEKTSGLRESVLEKTEQIGQKIAGAAEQTIGTVLETAQDMADKLAETEPVKKAAEISEQVGSVILEKGSDALKKAEELSENIGSKILKEGEALKEKAVGFTEQTGAVILEKGGEAMEKAKDLSEKIGEKVLEAKDQLVEKAKQTTDQLGKKMDDLMEKATEWEAQEAVRPKKEFADEDLNTKGSLLEGKDDFFSKAAQYADGHYDSFSEGKVEILGEKADSSRPVSRVAGQEDHDGDGDELIDDAIVVKEDE